MQNPQYPLLSTNALQFMPALSLRSTSSSASSPASSTSTGESSENSPTEGSVNRNRWPFFQSGRFCYLNLLSKRLKFRVKFQTENRSQVLITSKCRSVNKHPERMFSLESSLVKTQPKVGSLRFRDLGVKSTGQCKTQTADQG